MRLPRDRPPPPGLNPGAPQRLNMTIGRRPAAESSFQFGDALFPVSMAPTDGLVRFASAMRPGAAGSGSGTGLVPSDGWSVRGNLTFVGTKCCFAGTMGKQVVLNIKGARDDRPSRQAITPSTDAGSVCITQSVYGVQSVELVSGITALNNISLEADLPDVLLSRRRAIALNETLANLYHHQTNASMLWTDGSLNDSLQWSKEQDQFLLNPGSSIHFNLPPTARLFWMTGPTGPSLDGFQIHFNPNLTHKFDGSISQRSQFQSGPDGTLFLAPIPLGNSYQVTISAPEETPVNISNILIYNEEGSYKVQDVSKELKTERIINTAVCAAASAIAGILLLVFAGFLIRRRRRPIRLHDKDVRNLRSPTDAESPSAVPSPITPASATSASATPATAGEKEERLTEKGRQPSPPLRVLVADDVLRGPTSGSREPSSTSTTTPGSATSLLRSFRGRNRDSTATASSAVSTYSTDGTTLGTGPGLLTRASPPPSPAR